MARGRRGPAWWRTKHPLRPTETIVKEFLTAPSEQAWRRFRAAYVELLAQRFSEDRSPFDKLAELAKTMDVYLGCSCPTELNPRIDHCHTFLALRFMKRKYPSLDVRIPKR